MDKNDALQRCMKLCSTKEYAPSEIAEKLNSWGCDEKSVLEIITSLEKERFIDVYRFARYYANDKIKFNKWGRIKVSLMLKYKGIPEDAIHEALKQMNDDDYVSMLDSELRKKIKSIKDTDPYIIKGKLYQFASGRGFESDIIYKAIDNILK